jgi:hypothetical protein
MPLLKPKHLQTTAARAKKGETAANVELFFETLAAVVSGKQKPTFMQVVIFLAVCGVASGVGVGVYLLMRSHVQFMSTTDTSALRRTFYSGEPWVVECASTKKASPILYQTESMLGGLGLGVLDCAAKLPSGKSTYERFKLHQPNYGPVFLAAANTERPQIAPRNALVSPNALATWARGVTKAKMYTPNTAEQFDAQCVRKPWCLVVLTASGRLADAEKARLQTIVQSERRLRVVKVDVSKSNLLLDLPGGTPQPTAAGATLVLLRESGDEPTPAAANPAATAEAGAAGDEQDEETGGVTGGGRAVIATHLAAGLTDDTTTSKTIRAAIESEADLPAGFAELVKRPSLRPKRAPVPPSTYTPSSSPSTPDPKSKTYTDEELKAMRAEREKALKEAEMQRRRKMAEEEASAANLVEEVGAAGEGDGGGGGAGAAIMEEEEEGGDSDVAAEEEEAEAVEFD